MGGFDGFGIEGTMEDVSLCTGTVGTYRWREENGEECCPELI
jgi:hypothetical protein